VDIDAVARTFFVDELVGVVKSHNDAVRAPDKHQTVGPVFDYDGDNCQGAVIDYALDADLGWKGSVHFVLIERMASKVDSESSW